MGMTLGINRGMALNNTGRAGIRPPDFYADSVAGLDSNNGLTALTAKRTLSAVQALANAKGAGAKISLARGSYWREQYTVSINSLGIEVHGSGDMPVIDGADIITGTWTQPDVVNFPNVWSISWTRSEAASTGVSHMGYWEDGVRTTRYTSLALLQAGVNGGWHTNSLIFTTVTLSIRAASDPNSDGITREATKRGHGIDSHTQTTSGTWTGLNFVGPIEIKRCVEHYNALSMGRGTARQFLLRDGNIHHSVSEGDQTDVLAIEATASTAPSVWAFYRAASAGFNPVGTRLLSILPGGSARQDGASAFYAHGGTGRITSFTLNGCIARGCDFGNADATNWAVNGGYCEDAPVRPINFGAANTTVDHLYIHETDLSPFNSSNSGFFVAGIPATVDNEATMQNCAVHMKRGTGWRGAATLTRNHVITNCSFHTSGAACLAGDGAAPLVSYCVMETARNYDSFPASGYVGDYNIFYFRAQSNAQFVANSITYGSLGAWQTFSGQDANSVFCKSADQVSGNGIALWLGLANGENTGPPDGDWRINPNARVYNGAGATLDGVFADGVTPLTAAGVQEYYNFNTRAVSAGLPSLPTLPVTLADQRAYVENPTAWDFYP